MDETIFSYFIKVVKVANSVIKIAETIQGRKLFKEGNYSRAETICGNTVVNVFSDNQILWNILPWNFSCLNFLITTPVRAIQLQALKSHQIFCWATHHSRLSRQLNVEQQSHCMSFFGSFSFSPNEVSFMRNFQNYSYNPKTVYYIALSLAFNIF